MNLYHEFKIVKQMLIEQRWMFNEIQKQGKRKDIYKERWYNRSIIQSAFFFEKLSYDKILKLVQFRI